MKLILVGVLLAASTVSVVDVQESKPTRPTVLVPLVSREPELRASRNVRRHPLRVPSKPHHAGVKAGQPVLLDTQRERLNWRALSLCESGGNPRDNTGNGFYGAYQFDAETWASVGGHGLPSDASLAEQTYRAQLLYDRRGAQPWPACGHHLQDAA